MDGKIKKINWPTITPEYINSFKDINTHKQEFTSLYQQEWPQEMSTFISRLTDALQGKDNANRGRRKDDYVRVRVQDLDEILRQFENMDNQLREIHIDVDLRSEPTIINMPNSIEKEQFIKDNKDTLF